MPTYDLETDIGKVRLLISDRDTSHVFFQDEELQTFLDLEETLRRASALALETWASDRARVLSKVKLLDTETDGPAVAREMRARAEQLRAQDEVDFPVFETVEIVHDDFTHREKLLSEIQRTEL